MSGGSLPSPGRGTRICSGRFSIVSIQRDPTLPKLPGVETLYACVQQDKRSAVKGGIVSVRGAMADVNGAERTRSSDGSAQVGRKRR